MPTLFVVVVAAQADFCAAHGFPQKSRERLGLQIFRWPWVGLLSKWTGHAFLSASGSSLPSFITGAAVLLSDHDSREKPWLCLGQHHLGQ